MDKTLSRLVPPGSGKDVYEKYKKDYADFYSLASYFENKVFNNKSALRKFNKFLKSKNLGYPFYDNLYIYSENSDDPRYTNAIRAFRYYDRFYDDPLNALADDLEDVFKN